MKPSNPAFPHYHYRQNSLWVEDIPLQTLAQTYGTPLFVYSQQTILDAIAQYHDALKGIPNHLICFSVKANSNLAILQLINKAGCGFDIVSGGELTRVLATGAKADQVIFSGTGKTKAEMQQALSVGIKCFNVESLPELELLSQTALELNKKAPISFRINPDVDAKTHPYISTGLKNNKFGIAYKDALQAYQRAAQLAGIEITGIDCHIGSQITQTSPYLDALERLLKLVTALQEQQIPLSHIDLGGGLGIHYKDETPPSPKILYEQVIQRLKQVRQHDFALIVEPGRSIVGTSGALLTEVLYLKEGETKNFCIVDTAMNDLMRPALYQSYHEIVPLKQTGAPAQTCDVVGPICESSDWLGRERSLAVQPGDFLAILGAGAYSMTMASNYNTRPRAAEVLVNKDQAYLIRDREKVEDLYKTEHLLPS